jgi:hypothetical protein
VWNVKKPFLGFGANIIAFCQQPGASTGYGASQNTDDNQNNLVDT